MIRRLLLLTLSVSLTVSTLGWGFWTAVPGAGGSGRAVATSLGAGQVPTATASGGTVTVTWPGSTLSTGQPVPGYVVRRYDAGLEPVLHPVGAGCSGVVSGTSCTESGVPSGSWRYTVTPAAGTHWRGATSALGAAVAVDVTPPVNGLTITPLSGGTHLSGGTVHYRGVAAGGFQVTNALTDAHSGPASSTTALAGTTAGWTHAGSTVASPAGGPYVSEPLTWAAGTTSAPQLTVTGRDVFGNTASTSFALVDDSTPPAVSVTSTDGATSGRSVTVSFSASDSGSGVAGGTGRLRRASALLSNGVCGAFGAFADIGPSAPSSPFTDTNLANGKCYQYQYVVSDRVGNQRSVTSAATARVDYAAAIASTPGLVSHWRLGEAQVSDLSFDSMTAPDQTLLTSRSGETAASWAFVAGNDVGRIHQGRFFRDGYGSVLYRASAVPPNADYSVEAELVARSALTDDGIGVVGRLDAAGSTYYLARWEENDNSWNLLKVVGGTRTYLAAVVNLPSLTIGATYRLRLQMVGSRIRLYVNSRPLLAVTDTAITAKGSGGIADGIGGTGATKSSTVGVHADNFRMIQVVRAADVLAANGGTYENRPSMGVAGALSGDSNTATRFDGVNDYVLVAPNPALPTGGSSRSVEVWFKTTSTARQVLFAYGSMASAQQFSLWLNANGSSMTAWGWGAGHDLTFTLPGAVNDGSWHHVVKTYDGSVMTLYLDGVALPSQPATRGTVIDAYGFNIGAVVNPDDGNTGGFFNGSLDEMSFYSTALPAATVKAHHELGVAVEDQAAPTGGSVAVGGLAGTGGRWSTSTALPLTLTAGTDASGLASTGAVLRRATAALTSSSGAEGACGAFGPYAVVATDPAPTTTDSVADQACYRYQYDVPDVHGNTATYTSADVKVDSTAPAAPDLAFSGSGASAAGATVHYRSAVTGSLTVTATATDPASGIAAHTFPALGSGWTATAGTPGVTTYTWSAAPAAPGTVGVTARNHAGSTSAAAPMTFVVDDTPPTAGTVSYPDGATTSSSVEVTVTTGTDTGSGIGTTRVQRSSATLSGGTCGSFGAFADVAGGTDASGPVIDSVARGSCYAYRYVVRDRVGNETVATSPHVVKVLTYSEVVAATAGLVARYRLDEAVLSADAMTGSAGTPVSSRTGETAATWTRHAASGGIDTVITAGGAARKGGGTTVGSLHHTSATPASPSYTVEADVRVLSNLANDAAGVAGRIDPASTTYYDARYDQVAQGWVLSKVVNGVRTALGSSGQVLSAGSTHRLSLDMSGTTIRLLVDGVARVTAADAAISGAGRGGMTFGFQGSTATNVTDTTGLHLDNFRMSPPAADARGSAAGAYLGGPTLGAAGAIAGSGGTAVELDGADDQVTMPRAVSSDFSIELWFRSTHGVGTGADWWSGAGMVDAEVGGPAADFGVSLRADGRVVAGVGGGPNGHDTSIVSSAGGYHDDGWHHVVLTRQRSTGALVLYVDGTLAGQATGSTLVLDAPATVTLGRVQTGAFYRGRLDEVAFYDGVLTAEAVAEHHRAGR